MLIFFLLFTDSVRSPIEWENVNWFVVWKKLHWSYYVMWYSKMKKKHRIEQQQPILYLNLSMSAQIKQILFACLVWLTLRGLMIKLANRDTLTSNDNKIYTTPLRLCNEFAPGVFYIFFLHFVRYFSKESLLFSYQINGMMWILCTEY